MKSIILVLVLAGVCVSADSNCTSLSALLEPVQNLSTSIESYLNLASNSKSENSTDLCESLGDLVSNVFSVINTTISTGSINNAILTQITDDLLPRIEKRLLAGLSDISCNVSTSIIEDLEAVLNKTATILPLLESLGDGTNSTICDAIKNLLKEIPVDALKVIQSLFKGHELEILLITLITGLGTILLYVLGLVPVVLFGLVIILLGIYSSISIALSRL